MEVFKLCRLLLLVIIGSFSHLIRFSVSDPGSDCPQIRSASLVNFTYQFSMAQHQLRGVLKVIDDCSFKVVILICWKGLMCVGGVRLGTIWKTSQRVL